MDNTGGFRPANGIFGRDASLHFAMGIGKILRYDCRMPTKQELLDLQFIAARHQVVDVAAFLDRLDRHPGPPDFRLAAMRAALPILLSDRPDRARAVLEAFSDPTTEPIPKATFQGAFGAPQTP